MIDRMPVPHGQRLAAAVLAVWLVSCQSEIDRQADGGPYTLANSEVHRLESQAVGDAFEISIALPLSYSQTNERYPVVIQLDADLAFAASAQVSRLMQFRNELPDFIVVGIGYGDFNVALQKRARDFTPTVDATRSVCSTVDACGGAGRFAAFIETELLPFLAERYRVDLSDLTLVGNSQSALFGSYMLLQRPGTFRRYVLGSPTLSWDAGWAIEAASKYATEQDARVYIGVGGEEVQGVVNSGTFTENLRSADAEGLTVWFQVFEGERHMSAQPMIVSRGLRVVFGTGPDGL